ncbi:DUF262 domain-containing protein [Daejeonella oryzae]|uniref:DUF262 domain-containing protein n=1 Tax=Daejeonella oryzae TaxID=1122943 RepID=UPI0003FE6653|nr:DUF262 domain-containing protein [Daejeonella oryzae]
MNITPNKLSIAQLFATPNEQFIVPPYQRRYAWGFQQYLALYEDIDMLKDDDGHLFGMVILHTSFHTAGLNQPELVDGQQRLTTLVILLRALADVFYNLDKFEKSTEIEKMLSCNGLDDVKKPKIRLGELDNIDIENLLLHKNSTNISNPNILAAYESYREWLSELTFEEVNRFYFKLTNTAVIIRLDVGMAQDAYKLFETINNRGLRLTATDVIKNFLLGHAAKINSDHTLDKVKSLWSEIITNLDQLDSDDFLRHFMCATLKHKLSMSKLIYEFKKHYLRNVENADLLGEYGYYDYGVQDDDEDDVETGSNSEDTISNKISIIEFLTGLCHLSETYKQISKETFKDVKINRRISNLNNILSKPSYIFLMYFLQDPKYVQKTKLQVLEYLESLMLRRHICENRTSDNDDIFSKLVQFLGSDDLLNEIKQFIGENDYMPDDEDFALSFPKYQFKGRLVDRAKYILATIEYHLRGNTNELIVSSSGEVELEHIIPQTIEDKKSKILYGNWEEYLGSYALPKHKKHVNLIGNMTLLGESLNIQAYNNPFAKKKNSYKNSSFLITSELGKSNDFKFNNVIKRGESYSELALKIWKS